MSTPTPGKPSDRDIIYALRTTHQYQTGLVNLADQKANILIGLSLVSFTIVFTRTSWILEQVGLIRSGVLLFLACQLATVLAAVLVILPKMAPYPKSSSLTTSPNPMFFGFFTQFSQSEFIEFGMERYQVDEDARRSLLRDIYQVGAVLNRKYRILKVAYMLQATSIFLLFICALVMLGN